MAPPVSKALTVLRSVLCCPVVLWCWQRLRDVYSGQLASACPQRDVLFHCALGLSLTCMPGDTELAVRILEQLLSSGYMRSQCALQLAKCLHREGRIVRARQLLSDCLAEDPRNADALDFQYDFDLAVKRDGKIALYGAIGLLAAIAIAWTAYKQGSGNNIGSSGLTAVQQIKAPSGTAVGSALIAR